MTSRSWPIGALLLLALPCASAADEGEGPAPEQYRVRLEYSWWSPQPDGDVQRGQGETPGTLLDLRSDLGLTQAAANFARGRLRFGGSWNLHGAWTRFDDDGDVTAETAFSYGGMNVSPGQQVLTSVKGDYVAAELERELVRRSRGCLGLLMGVKYFDVGATLVAVEDAQNASRVTESERLPVPVFGITTRVYPLDWVSVEATISGLPAGDRGHVYDVLLAGHLHMSDRLAGTLGWRTLDLEARGDRDYLGITLSKWIFGVEISL